MNEINYQEWLRDDYHKYLELAEKLPEEMRKRGVFESTCNIDYFPDSNRKNREKSTAKAFFNYEGNFEVPDVKFKTKFSFNSIDKVLGFVSGREIRNLQQVSYQSMKDALNFIESAHNSLKDFDFYLPKK